MTARVYIGKLPDHAREKDVERFFRGYGKVREVSLKKGYGFVEFDSSRDADDAIYDLNGKDLCGERVLIQHAQGSRFARDRYRNNNYRSDGGDSYGSGYSYGHGRSNYRTSREDRPRPVWYDKYGPPTRTSHQVIVTNLSSRVSWQDLKDYMRQAGEVSFADAHKKHLNEGVVEFTTRDEMLRAVEKLDGTEINGRRVGVRESSTNRDKSRSRSRRSRSKSYSRSRSRSRSRSGRSWGSPSARKRSRSHSRDDRSISRENGGSRLRSRSKSQRLDDRSPLMKKTRSRSRSDAPRSRSRSLSDAPRSRSRTTSRSRSRTRSRSRSPLS